MKKLSCLLTCMAALNVGARAEAAEAKTGESLASAYRLVADFPRLPAGWSLGAASGVATDSLGNVLVFHAANIRFLSSTVTESFCAALAKACSPRLTD